MEEHKQVAVFHALIYGRKKTERGGFEPPDPGLPGQLLSREPDSASLAPLHLFLLSEREGFEPPETCASAVFKTATIDHSDISPVED